MVLTFMTGWTVEEVVAHTDKNVDILDVFVFFCCCLLDYYYNFGFRTIFPLFLHILLVLFMGN